jgi:predicted RNase H-like HicB family nuclease
MKVPVLVEPAGERGFRATCLTLCGVEAFGTTRDEAVTGVHDMIRQRVSSGEYREFEVSANGDLNPILALAGTWEGREDIDEFIENIDEYRRQLDSTPGLP